MQLAQRQLETAQEKAAEAQQQKLEAKAAQANISAQLEELCNKRQRVGEAPAAAEAEAPLLSEEEAPPDGQYYAYSLMTWRRLEAEAQERRKLGLRPMPRIAPWQHL